eukprot:COSAG01_NODE_56377_length_318_cov_16.625571_1_plen_38_part_01
MHDATYATSQPATGRAPCWVPAVMEALEAIERRHAMLP